MQNIEQRHGFLSAVPLCALLLLAFVAPLLLVAAFSFMPPNVFSFQNAPTFANYQALLNQGYYGPILWSLGLAFGSTTSLFLICYPLAYGMAKVFGRFTLVITVGVVITLFVAENIRLFGWMLSLMKGGMLLGPLEAWLGISLDSPLYTTSVVFFGLVYTYFPFMLFPLAQGIAMIPEEMRHAAVDLGASRTRVLFEIDLPLAMPGIMVGWLLTFVLAAGAVSESKILGGQVMVVASEEIETAFNYSQNWPFGSALAMIMILVIGSLAFLALSKIDLDRIMGQRT